MSVLVDSSVWIAFFRGVTSPSTRLDSLLEEGRVVVNELILCELIPALHVRNQFKLIHLLRAIPCIPLSPHWLRLETYQTCCLQKGFNGIGIPDLLIAQNAIDSDIPLFSLDKHFNWIAACTPLKILDVPTTWQMPTPRSLGWKNLTDEQLKEAAQNPKQKE
jgi:predicted nucleic acid-binding protein